jgi:hypothetical protein
MERHVTEPAETATHAEKAADFLSRPDPGMGYWSHHEAAMHAALRGIGHALLAINETLAVEGERMPGWVEVTDIGAADGIRTFMPIKETAT